MSVAKASREGKRQLGQFLTPYPIARAILGGLRIDPDAQVLEPSFGKGSFIDAYADLLEEKGVDVAQWASTHLHGCELDRTAFDAFRLKWAHGNLPDGISQCDFFRFEMPSYVAPEYFRRIKPKYDLVVGNPPFGGTIAADIQDELDSIYGFRHGCKIKKETYAFFIVKCLDLLKPGGRLVFICSDTLLSINTMSGLRKYLMDTCSVDISRLPGEFDDTKQPMIVLSLVKGERGVTVFGEEKPHERILRTANASWTITTDMARYFTGATLGDYMTATSGMTVGKNEYFLREIVDGVISEPYSFNLCRRPVTLERELQKARLGKMGDAKRKQTIERERRGETEVSVDVVPRNAPLAIRFPNKDYAPYNKATSDIVYSPPRWAIYWKNDGEAVYAFKKSGPWYLHGVGGKPYFRREGLTWQLISSRLNIRHLPAGYILDSGSPCAFLKKNVDRDEMYFIMGWCLTDLCNAILKTVINHTRNIQSKDFERLPYPVWVGREDRRKVVSVVKNLVEAAENGKTFTYNSSEIEALSSFFEMKDGTFAASAKPPCRRPVQAEFAFAS